ncbi:WD40-like Beta Propeller [Sesbania bispinosa]|nr:WD40-like Beta Propeller [Sesbania bispinosa]
MKARLLPFLLITLLLPLSWAAEKEAYTSIIFTTLGRAFYAFDIYSLPIHPQQPPTPNHELRLTDGRSVNFNGHFLSNNTAIQLPTNSPPLQLVYVTERNGFPTIYYDAVYTTTSTRSRRRSALESVIKDRIQVPLLPNQLTDNKVSIKDKPSVSADGEYLVYVSTHEDPGVSRAGWTAVYSTHLPSGQTLRLTPYGVADFSPALSPSGVWTAVASYGAAGWSGEVEDLSTDIYVFLTRDGTQRVKVVEHGGWPCWVDDRTLYFHRRGHDQWWSIYRAILPADAADSVVIERVTPPGLHVFTPATSPGNHKFIAVATRRPDSKFRHIELFDLVKNEFRELTRFVSPRTHHLNPFISPDSTRVGYHKCRGEPNRKKNDSPQFLFENVQSPVPGLTLFRFIGSFPVFSPSGDQIAYVEMPGVYVVNRDGSNLRKVSDAMAFSTAWDPVRPGVIYTAIGETFAPESSKVDIVSIDINNNKVKRLTVDGKNNAFPSLSTDGKWIVFRSGRTGHKNLYVMDAVGGEKKSLRRLTEGPWTDTMCNWSPDGEWIAFASDRHDPGTGSFEIYLIHPDGTGLRKLIQSGSGGRTNHPYFSPDGKSIVFTSDYAAISAEPISNPHHYQPYGEIFTIRLDGSGMKRLTHNSYEDGTPAWSPKYMKPVNVERPKGPYCSFEDCHWLNNIPNGTLVDIPASTNTYYTRPESKTQCGL